MATEDEPWPLPPVEQVRPGIWSIPVPLPAGAMRFVSVYAFETGRGPFLFDAGWDTDEAWSALGAGLATMGTRVEDVQGVVATHVHPDHYSLCGRVRQASGAWVGLHPADAATIPDRYEHPEVGAAMVAATWRRAGVPAGETGPEILAEQAKRAERAEALGVVRPDLLIEDGGRPDIPGWDLTTVS